MLFGELVEVLQAFREAGLVCSNSIPLVSHLTIQPLSLEDGQEDPFCLTCVHGLINGEDLLMGGDSGWVRN